MDDDGFLKTVDYLQYPVETSKPGVYVAGCCERPKDITESVIQASAAAAKAAVLAEG